jgi:hypothetical protein
MSVAVQIPYGTAPPISTRLNDDTLSVSQYAVELT